ncbi:MAG: ABC transporter permease [Desulfobacteraceae bacterium]|jgi:peptide/nickel transport system permease protein|nr:MAG: ABC transporter permease [Desulfobacteraceae bacterium]
MMVFRGIAWRLLYLFIVLSGISLGVFALFALAPGDPAEIILRERSEAPDRDQIALLRREMGLDDPWVVQYSRWMKRVCTGQWGESWRSGRPVWTEIAARGPATIELALASFFLVVTGSLFCGIIAAFRQNRIPDRLIQAATVVASAMPSYWLGLMLIYFFSLKMNLLPVTGRGSWPHLVLPAFTLALSVAVLQGRVLRAALIQIMVMDYIRFAVSKGLSPWKIFVRHILRNALAPMATLWGISLGQLLGGAVIVESIFAWPGLGRLTVEAVMGRDIPLVQAIVLLMAMIFVTVNQIVDGLHRQLDPKVGAAG